MNWFAWQTETLPNRELRGRLNLDRMVYSAETGETEAFWISTSQVQSWSSRNKDLWYPSWQLNREPSKRGSTGYQDAQTQFGTKTVGQSPTPCPRMSPPRSDIVWNGPKIKGLRRKVPLGKLSIKISNKSCFLQ
jgi:hypothetical protein